MHVYQNGPRVKSSYTARERVCVSRSTENLLFVTRFSLSERNARVFIKRFFSAEHKSANRQEGVYSICERTHCSEPILKFVHFSAGDVGPQNGPNVIGPENVHVGSVTHECLPSLFLELPGNYPDRAISFP